MRQLPRPHHGRILTAKFGLILGILLALACMPAVAGATHASGTSPDEDKVTGSTKFILPEAHVRIEAHSDANGQNPRGSFYLEQDPYSFGGEITCLTVSGNKATIGGRVDRSRPGDPLVGSGWFQEVEDNGEPGDMDRSLTTLTATAPTICPTPTVSALVTAEQGNYVVHDATP